MELSKKCYCCTSWTFRNDSSNVAAILHPLQKASGNIIERKLSRHSSCYCTEKLIKPQLFQRPRKCIFNENNEDDEDGGNITMKSYPKCRSNIQNPVNYRKQLQLIQKGTDNQARTSTPAMDYRKKITQSHTNSKKNYDGKTDTNIKNQENQKETRLQNYQNYDVNGSSLSSHSFNFYDQNLKNFFETYDYPTTSNEDEGDTIVEKKSKSKDKKSFPTTTEAEDKTTNDKTSEAYLKQLSDFRKDYYFETHSTEDLLKTIPEHTCVHRFGLDNRFLPESLNADVYGESCCIICGKRMENPTVDQTDERTVSDKKGIFPQFYKYGLAPKKIYVASDNNVKIEMKMKKWQEDDIEDNRAKGKQPNYCNTFALRYQKGVK